MNSALQARSQAHRRVTLFATCMVDQIYPEVAEAVVTVLERCGVEVDVPAGLTCCGQPAFNSGYWDEARAVAGRTLELLRDAGEVVLPSGSCASMICHGYPELFADHPALRAAAEDLARRTYEFSSYLVDVLGITDVGAHFPATLTIHDACHGLRVLGIKQQPRALLAQVAGAQLVELPDAERCCGFGGLFAVKLAPISEALGADKAASIEASGAQYAVTGDVSCMTHINGCLSRVGARCRVLHLAQVLAGAPLGALQTAEAQPEAGDRHGSSSDHAV
ncbi:(Fe-S)-binding protein [Kallotenue papyrolyticum]|uniref:(Fe-S)-binding protein n=1 Tax=Kallotenue papyrolyticum TaxID=1325125 RepID=UPI000492B049|nr:(Fe-S)-binding protein [Kallotenue papyrolyticum]